MLFAEEAGRHSPLIVLLHWLGGSTRSWSEVSQALASRGFRCVAFDLPGFGEASGERLLTVAETAEQLRVRISAFRKDAPDTGLVLVGHSMGGKLSTILARMAENDADLLHDLRALVLVSPSPPGPEPMTEKKRSHLLESLGRGVLDPKTRRQNAEEFVDENTGRLPLLPDVRQRSVDDVLRMDPDALVAWVTDGSKEDWSDRVGQLRTPALVLAGTEDKALGPNSQSEHTLPHLEHGTLAVLEGGGHLAPLERPAELADRIVEFLEGLGVAGRLVHLGQEFAQIIASDRTSYQTREVLLARLNAAAGGGVFTPEDMRTLRALAERVVPGASFDLAARIDAMLAEPAHDGWRFDRLPQDKDAWRQGILSLDLAAKRDFKVPFVALDAPRRDELLRQAQQGELGKGLAGSMHLSESANAFDSDQMQKWFEDVRSELAKLYVADPRAMERIGFTGFADEKGFTHIQLGNEEPLS